MARKVFSSRSLLPNWLYTNDVDKAVGTIYPVAGNVQIAKSWTCAVHIPAGRRRVVNPNSRFAVSIPWRHFPFAQQQRIARTRVVN